MSDSSRKLSDAPTPRVGDTPRPGHTASDANVARQLTFEASSLGNFSSMDLSENATMNEGEDSSDENHDLDAQNEGEGTPQDALLNALLENNIAKFEDLLKSKKVIPHLRYGKPYYGTCLEIACKQKWGAPFVSLLLKMKVSPNVQKIHPEPIHIAAKRGYIDSLRVLLANKNIKLYALDSRGCTALHLACLYVSSMHEKEYTECIKLLMEKMSLADINKPDQKGFTAFHALLRGESVRRERRGERQSGGGKSGAVNSEAQRTRERVAKMMLQTSRGTLDVDSSCARGLTAREEVERRVPSLIHLLPVRKEALRLDPHAPLVDAIRDNRIDDFRLLLRQTDSDGCSVLDPNYVFDSPLYASCLDLACRRSEGEEFVRALLEAGADPNVPNKHTEDFPIHLTCDGGYHTSLKVLLDFQADVNCSDKSGNTPLHRILDKSEENDKNIEDWQKCFDLLLTVKDLDVNRENDDQIIPLTLAIRNMNKYVIEKALEDECHDWNFHIHEDEKSMELVLLDLFRERNEDLQEKLKKRLAPTTSLKMRCRLNTIPKDSSQLFGLLYLGKENEFVTQLNELLPNREIQNLQDGKFNLLQRAAYYGRASATEALLEAGVEPNAVFEGNRSPPIVLAASNKHIDVIKVIIKKAGSDAGRVVNEQDAKGFSALHFASRAGNLEMVVLLLWHGADIRALNKLKKPPFDAQQMKTLLDQCVSKNYISDKRNYGIGEENYQITFDYRLLAPNHISNEDEKDCCRVPIKCKEVDSQNRTDIAVLEGEMDFLSVMSETEELSNLLHHPVAWSFLQLKWKRLKCFMYFNIIIYVIFVLALLLFIILNKSNSLRNDEGFSPEAMAILLPLASVTCVFWCFLLFREIIQFGLDEKTYFLNWENYLDWSVLLLSLAAVALPFITQSSTPYTSMIYVDVLTIMLSCTEFLILLGRISYFATNIEMLKVVIKSYFWPLLSYCVILVAFGLSFHIISGINPPSNRTSNHSNCSNILKKNDTDNFSIWYLSVVKSLVMMTGELEFDSYPEHSFLSVTLMVLFVLLVTVVLLNLLTGVAVSDTQRIERAAQCLRLQTRVGVVLRLERALRSWLRAETLLGRWLPMPCWLKRRMREAFLFAGHYGDRCRLGIVTPSVSPEVVLCCEDKERKSEKKREEGRGEERRGDVEQDEERRGERDEGRERKRKKGEGVVLKRKVLQSAFHILSEKKPTRVVSLDQVDAKVNTLLDMMKDISRMGLTADDRRESAVPSPVNSR